MKRTTLLGVAITVLFFGIPMATTPQAESQLVSSECTTWERGMDPHTESLCQSITFLSDHWSSSVTDLYIANLVETPDGVNQILIGCSMVLDSTGNGMVNVCGKWWLNGTISYWYWSSSLDHPPTHINADGTLIDLPWTGIYSSNFGYLYVDVRSFPVPGANSASGVLPD